MEKLKKLEKTGNLDLRVGSKYRLERKIGSGAFGAVYLGLDDDTGDKVAIKLEHSYSMEDFSQLENEVTLYKTLAGVGIPRVHWNGSVDDYKVMVFDLLGPSLEELLDFCGGKFSLKTVLMIANQLIYRIGHIHSKQIIHRDIKPDNVLMGIGRRGNHVYIIDMGISKEYESVEQKYSRPAMTRLVGSELFASRRGHVAVDQSPRDDMESLGYLMLYLLRGSLPWQNIEATAREQKLERIKEMKETIGTSNLCNGLPKEFAAYFDHVHSLQFGDKPHYSYLRRIFNQLFNREGFKWNQVFDWTIQKHSMAQSSAGDCRTDSL